MKLDRAEIEGWLKDLPGRLREGARELPGLLAEPRRVSAWAARNPRLPLAMLAAIVAVPLLLPLVDQALSFIYRPVTEKKLFGLVNTVREDERLRVRQVQARWLLWTAAVAGSAGFFLIQVPLIRLPREDEPAPGSDATIVDNAASRRTVGPEGRYLISSETGRGAMGIVYAATDTVLGREVAIKELPPHLASDPANYERFRREARALANLSHPGIVQLYDLLEDGGRVYLVMELVRGGTLQELVENTGVLPLERACGFGLDIARALSSVHARGIVHRDLKPGNILLTEDGQPKITDFGVARLAHETGMTLEGSVIGSPNYMSPEQASGKVADHRSDLYSFGVLLYWLVTGTTPYSGDVPAILSQHMTAAPEPPSTRNSAVSGDVERTVLELMEKDPGKRVPDLEGAISVLAVAARG